MLKSIKHAKITGISVVVPSQEISIYDEIQYYDNNIKKLERARKMVGFFKRRIVDEDTTAADLGVVAANRLIDGMGIDRSKIEAMIFVVQQPDYPGPCTSYSMHHRLGLSKDCYVTDIVQGCVGWCLGLFTAFQMIENKTFKSVLLITADTPTKGIRQDDRKNAPLFGDAGCATFIEYDENAPEITFNLESFSDGYEAIIGPARGKRMFSNYYANEEDFKILTAPIKTQSGYESHLWEGYMDGVAVFEFSTQKVPENIQEIMSATGTTPADYPLLCLHQANKQIIQIIGENAGFDIEKVPYTAFEQLGNNTMCSIPSVILLNKQKELKNEKTTLLCSGFGNGLVVCSCNPTFDHLKCAEITLYEPDPTHKTNKEWIEYWRNKIANT